MDLIKQILASFEGTLPNDSKTAAAIARGAGPEEISACATEEGMHALAGALFEACEEGSDDGHLDGSARVTGALGERLKEFRQGLPPACETARLIDAGNNTRFFHKQFCRSGSLMVNSSKCGVITFLYIFNKGFVNYIE